MAPSQSSHNILRGRPFQGGRSKLPGECQEDPKKYYVEMDYIWTLLKQKRVVLIKGSWLLERSKAVPFEPLPCRQDLPDDALVDVEKLQKLAGLKCFQHFREVVNPLIVAISHCWLSQDHPDPDGYLLKELAPFIEFYLESNPGAQMQYFEYGFGVTEEEVYVELCNLGGAFFFAWCSIYQPYHAKSSDGKYQRLANPKLTDEQSQSHREALENMDIWYTHANTEIWLLTKYFACQGKPYDARGWPTWESSVAGLLSQDGCVLDLGMLESHDLRSYTKYGNFWEIRELCSKTRKPPLEPEAFQILIDGKHFTCGDMDRPVIKANYMRNFQHAVACMTFGYFAKTGWNMDFQVLQQCSNLEELDLGGNQIEDVQAASLIESLRHCSKLRVLKMDRNCISFDKDCALAEGLQHLSELHHAVFSFNPIGDVGACVLASGLWHCSKLERLYLNNCQIGNFGAFALAKVLQHSSRFKLLFLRANHIGNAGACVLMNDLGQNRLDLRGNQISNAGA